MSERKRDVRDKREKRDTQNQGLRVAPVVRVSR
jgi:hypothetical protein